MLKPRPRRIIVANKPGLAGIVPIPNYLKPIQVMKYPIDNAVTFERWYLNSYNKQDACDRLYLPIQWTALYCNNAFGKNQGVLYSIQSFLNTLDKTKKYYTIVQFDDGILNDLSGLDIVVCAMSGKRIDYPLPLLCTPHKYKFKVKERDILASFVGSITHPIRKRIVNDLKGKDGYYIETKTHSIQNYCEILARSKYVLCPRGYGQSSFRIQEAIDYGAVPVYISDEFIVPYNEDTGAVLFDINIMPCFIDEFLHVTSVNYRERLESIERYKNLFTYEGCKQKILQHLKSLESNEAIL